jgi:hypothetical protein
MMECWNIEIMGWRPSGRYTPAAVVNWKILKMVLIIPINMIKFPSFDSPFHYSIIPLFLFGICRMVGGRFPIINNL